MKAGQLYWGHSGDESPELWIGAFETREQAIEDGRQTYKVDFWVASGRAISPSLEAEDVYEMLDERSREDAIWSDEPITVQGGQPMQALQHALDEWIAAHVCPQAWLHEGGAELIRVNEATT